MTTKEKEKTTESVGDTGAKRSSQMKGNPRAILRQIMDETPAFERPKDREQVIYGKMKYRMSEIDKINLDGYPLLLAMFEYWFTNEYRNLTPRPKPVHDESDDAVPHNDRTDTAEGAAAKKEEVVSQKAKDVAQAKETIKAVIRKILLLDTIMPNGKPLRECAKEDLSGLRGDIAKIEAQMKPGQIVGNVFTDDDLKTIQQ
jgi:hypothetical protein